MLFEGERGGGWVTSFAQDCWGAQGGDNDDDDLLDNARDGDDDGDDDDLLDNVLDDDDDEYDDDDDDAGGDDDVKGEGSGGVWGGEAGWKRKSYSGKIF